MRTKGEWKMRRTRVSRPLFGGVALLVLGMFVTLLVIGSSVGKAETGKKALVLDSSVSGGASSPEATRATTLGFTVTVVNDATWGAMTAAQFADYQLIVVGDATCDSLPQAVSQNAKALADAVMARAGGNTKAGNRILVGTDPVYHYGQGGNKVVDMGIDFAGVQEGASGLYLDFTCGDSDYDSSGVPDGQEKLLPLLSVAPSPVWTQNEDPPCGGAVSLISNAAQFSSLKTSDIQGWECSVHETFPTFPTDWSALAIATDTTTKPTCGNDVDTGEAKCGEAYLLIAGSGIVSEAPNLSLTPTTATNPVGTPHTVTASVTNTNGTPRSDVLVEFVVTGANSGATGTCAPSDCKTDGTGKVTFTYTGTKEGDDTINAAITVDGSRQTATASKTWTAGGGGEGADVAILKTAPATRTNGYHLVYTIKVTNNGPAMADHVRVTDVLPASLIRAIAETTKGTCSITGSTELTVSCNLGLLHVSETATVTVTAQTALPHGGTITNTATVASSTSDPISSNNSSSATTIVTP
jgi:uncharacterized repeat protein (TIGR01451 family)